MDNVFGVVRLYDYTYGKSHDLPQTLDFSDDSEYTRHCSIREVNTFDLNQSKYYCITTYMIKGRKIYEIRANEDHRIPQKSFGLKLTSSGLD